MAFRNPVHSLPADRITGQLDGAQIKDGAIVFPHLKGPLSSAAAVRYLDMMDDASLWESVTGAGTWGMTTDATAPSTGTVLQSVGPVSMRGRVRIPYDPDVLYRVSVRLRCKTQVGGTVPDVSVGLFGFAADGVTAVNRNGAALLTLHNYCCASSRTVAPAAGWIVVTGYVRGRANPGSGGPNLLMTAPGTMHDSVRFVAPYVRMDQAVNTGSTFQVDKVSVDAVYTGLLTAEAVAAGAIDGQVITGATVRTSATYPRVQMDPDGNLYFYPSAGVDPARILVDGSTGAMQIIGPASGGVEYGLTLQKAFGATSLTVDTDDTTFVGDAVVQGMFGAANVVWGSVNITPVANTNTSVTVTGLGLPTAGSYRVLLTAFSGVPSVLRPPTANNASSDGFTLWVNRSDATPMTVWFLMLAK